MALVATGASAQAPQPAGLLKNSVDSSQYIIGVYFAKYLEANYLSLSNPDLFKQGMEDALGGDNALVETDSITSLMTDLIFKSTKTANIEQEKQLFDGLRILEGINSTPSGVFYTIRKVGTGAIPNPNDSVIIHYKGYLPKGALFQDSYIKNSPMRTTPDGLIEGMKEIIQLMPEGSLWRIYIPSALAYGENGVPGLIPIFSAVIFDLELVTVKPGKRTRERKKN